MQRTLVVRPPGVLSVPRTPARQCAGDVAGPGVHAGTRARLLIRRASGAPLRSSSPIGSRSSKNSSHTRGDARLRPSPLPLPRRPPGRHPEDEEEEQGEEEQEEAAAAAGAAGLPGAAAHRRRRCRRSPPSCARPTPPPKAACAPSPPLSRPTLTRSCSTRAPRPTPCGAWPRLRPHRPLPRRRPPPLPRRARCRALCPCSTRWRGGTPGSTTAVARGRGRRPVVARRPRRPHPRRTARQSGRGGGGGGRSSAAAPPRPAVVAAAAEAEAPCGRRATLRGGSRRWPPSSTPSRTLWRPSPRPRAPCCAACARGSSGGSRRRWAAAGSGLAAAAAAGAAAAAAAPAAAAWP